MVHPPLCGSFHTPLLNTGRDRALGLPRQSLNFVSYHLGTVSCLIFCPQYSHIFSSTLPHPHCRLMTSLPGLLNKWKSLEPNCSLSTTKFSIFLGQHSLPPPPMRTEDLSVMPQETRLITWAVNPILSPPGPLVIYPFCVGPTVSSATTPSPCPLCS